MSGNRADLGDFAGTDRVDYPYRRIYLIETTVIRALRLAVGSPGFFSPEWCHFSISLCRAVFPASSSAIAG